MKKKYIDAYFLDGPLRGQTLQVEDLPEIAVPVYINQPFRKGRFEKTVQVLRYRSAGIYRGCPAYRHVKGGPLPPPR